MSFGLGILYPAPTIDGAIFNESNFTSFGSTNLTYDQAKNYFVTYPISQGGEQTFLGDLNVAGELYADGGCTIGSVNTNTSFEQTSNILTITNNFSGTNQIDFQTTNLSWNGVTLGTGSGDAFLARTQTFTGVNTFNNASGIVLANSGTTATTTSIFQNSDTNCHFASSVVGGGIRIQDPNVGATLAVNSNGLTINKGLQIGNTVGTNIVQMVADSTINNQLNITGSVNVSNTQSYPSVSSQILATIFYVNSAIGTLTNLLTNNNIWTGTNAFNTSTPTTTITQTYPQNSNTTQFSTIGYVNSAVAGLPNTGAPIGTIQMWAGNTFAPTGYVFCSGQSYSTTGTYASLFVVLGYTYGGSGGSFNVPAFHNGSYGVFPIGAQYTYGSPIGVVQSGGASGTVYQLQTYNGDGSYINANQLAPHDHTINPPQASYAWNTNTSGNTTTGGTSSRVTGLQTATFPTATNGMTNFNPTVPSQLQAQYYPPYCAVMFIIKYI